MYNAIPCTLFILLEMEINEKTKWKVKGHLLEGDKKKVKTLIKVKGEHSELNGGNYQR